MLMKLLTHTELFLNKRRIKRPLNLKNAKRYSMLLHQDLNKFKIKLRPSRKLKKMVRDLKKRKQELNQNSKLLINKLMKLRRNSINKPKIAKKLMMVSKRLLKNQRRKLKSSIKQLMKQRNQLKRPKRKLRKLFLIFQEVLKTLKNLMRKKRRILKKKKKFQKLQWVQVLLSQQVDHQRE